MGHRAPVFISEERFPSRRGTVEKSDPVWAHPVLSRHEKKSNLCVVTMSLASGLWVCVKSTKQLSWGTLFKTEMKLVSDDMSWMASYLSVDITASVSHRFSYPHSSPSFCCFHLHASVYMCLSLYVYSREREKHLGIQGSPPTGELQQAKHQFSLQSVSWTLDLDSNRKSLSRQTPPQSSLWWNRSLSHAYSL